MPKVIVKTGTPLDGEFDVDLKRFTHRERAYITRYSGTRPPEFYDQFFGEDPLTTIATVGVMMQRAGRDPDLDILLDADDKSIVFDFTDYVAEEKAADDGPPSLTPSDSGALGENSDGSESSG